MPTVDQLQSVIVAADDDEIPVSQGGFLRRVSRSQLLAGMQPTLSLTSGLLGRTSAGYGPPESITVSGGLTLADGVLSAPAPFTVAALAQGTVATISDSVPISRGGRDMVVPLGALLSAPGADVSGQVVTSLSGNARRLSDWIGDALHVEAFGAIGDGVTDDSAAFARALASGQPIRLGAKTYRVDGQWTIAAPAVLLGVAGVTTLRRTNQSGGAWISISGVSFSATGIVFDAGGQTGDSWAVQVNASCSSASFDSCTFRNSQGLTLGTGLTIQARDGLAGPGSAHTIRNCTFHDNAVHGLWVQAASGALVEGCSAFQNGSYGICIDFNDPSFQQVARQCAIVGCRSWSNQRGISVGNYNEINLEPPRWGPGNPDARNILVAGNICSNNLLYGIAVSGQTIQVRDNTVSADPNVGSSGYLFNCSQSQLISNVAIGSGQFGIDAGGCVDCDISCNFVAGFNVGINAGGGNSVRVTGNQLSQNLRAITAFQVETDGAGANFGIACSDLHITGNEISIPSSGGAGILLFDGPDQVVVQGNFLRSTDDTAIGRALLANTDHVMVDRNVWNGNPLLVPAIVAVGGQPCLSFPDVADRLSVPEGITVISGLFSQHQLELAGQISFIRVTAGGSGYQSATIVITGSGRGAQAQPYLRDGVLIGVAVTQAGSGYSPDSTQVAIVGDGQGAAAVGVVGLPAADGRRLKLSCETPTSLPFGGNVGGFDNWTETGVTVPAKSEVDCVCSSGRWRTTACSAVDFIVPSADGSLLLRSITGDVTLQPHGGGAVRFSSDAESGGFVSCLGRGSPEGIVAAPPGSDYRNLDGGAGQTLWLKQNGTGSVGWAAIG